MYVLTKNQWPIHHVHHERDLISAHNKAADPFRYPAMELLVLWDLICLQSNIPFLGTSLRNPSSAFL